MFFLSTTLPLSSLIPPGVPDSLILPLFPSPSYPSLTSSLHLRPHYSAFSPSFCPHLSPTTSLTLSSHHSSFTPHPLTPHSSYTTHQSNNRHFSGMLACGLMVYTQVLYFSVEMIPREGDFQLESNPSGITALIVLQLFFGKSVDLTNLL